MCIKPLRLEEQMEGLLPVRIKAGVVMWGLRPIMHYAVNRAAAVCASMGVDCVITSAREGTGHSDNSLHYLGLAVDIRTRDLPAELREEFEFRVRNLLGKRGFDVVLEKSHLHIEYDPKSQ